MDQGLPEGHLQGAAAVESAADGSVPSADQNKKRKVGTACGTGAARKKKGSSTTASAVVEPPMEFPDTPEALKGVLDTPPKNFARRSRRHVPVVLLIDSTHRFFVRCFECLFHIGLEESK